MKYCTLSPKDALDRAKASIFEDPRLVLCGGYREQREVEETVLTRTSEVDDIIEEAREVNVQDWFEQRKSTVEDTDDVLLSVEGNDGSSERESKPAYAITSDFLTGGSINNVVGVELEIEESWQIPAYFNFGGWNECPRPEIHCAIWRFWQECYGAYIVGINTEVIEAHVRFPPMTTEASRQLAERHYLYCNDLISQGYGSITKLAGGINNHDCWCFWWD